MTTGATGQLGLALPVQGELSGTWGDTVNNGITQYTNIAIAGTLTLTGDGAVTLANTTGDASASNITATLAGAGTVTAQFAIVRVTGTLTAAKVVTGPSYSKTYTVVNAATGGIVTFKASGQTGVSIAVGESAFVYFNGTDYVKLVGTATAGAAGGSNTQVQFNSSGVLAGSANMTFDGTTLTAAGFSGPLNGTVGSTTPAAVSATTLSASSTVTLSGGTANGVTYLNGSKVVTSGSALYFDGTNLGVGTTSPSNRLVVGSVSDASNFLRINSSTVQTVFGSDASGGYVGTDNSYALRFFTNNTERARIDTSGNLLVGTTSATAKFTVESSSLVARFTQTSAAGVAQFKNGSDAGYGLDFLNVAGSSVGAIYWTGTATTYATSSDYRLKNSIAPMTGALAKVALLKPCTYKWNADGSDGQGFIAHELAEVVPQCVTGEKDAVDEDGNPKYQGIDTSFLVATLTAAIQELKAEFDAYKASHP